MDGNSTPKEQARMLFGYKPKAAPSAPSSGNSTGAAAGGRLFTYEVNSQRPASSTSTSEGSHWNWKQS